MVLRGTYTRWTKNSSLYDADILSDMKVSAFPEDGTVQAIVPPRHMSPDEARMIGVRLIEAACLADGDRAVRHVGGPV